MTLAICANLTDDAIDHLCKGAPSIRECAPAPAAVTYDTTGPVATVDLGADQAATTSASPVKFAVTFNESVTEFTTDAITISGTAGATAGTITGSGAAYTVTVSTIPNNGTIVLTVAADAVYDTTGNGSPKLRSPTVPMSQQTPKPSS